MNEQISDRQSALDEFAAAAAPKQELLPAIQKAAPPALIHGAQLIVVPRDDAAVLRKISALGNAAGEDWYYRIPFKDNKTGKTTWVEGPSIKLANDVARIYGSCDVDTWVSNEGIDYWEISARFIDLESGFALTRLFRQRKGAARVGGGDAARNQEISFQIGTSKAIRNVVVNALQTYADYAYEQARSALVTKIGKDVDKWRERAVERVSAMVALPRVEAVIGRPARDWLAPDIAKVVAMGKAINDGMATVDETFPPLKQEAVTGAPALEQFAGDKTKTEEKPVAEKPGKTVDPETPADPDPSSAAGQAAASNPEPPAIAKDAAAAPLRQEAITKLLDLASDEKLSMQDRGELLEDILPTWEDKLDAAFFKELADSCAQVLDGRIRRATAEKRLGELK
jgi:hypothetical protein